MLSPGARLGPYAIGSLIGTGGMGDVYRASDTRLGREVAIKVLPPKLAEDPASLDRFRREARAVAALSHPNIVAIFDVGSDNGVHYAVTELLEGETLRTRFARGAMELREALRIMLDIAEGVAAAHSRNIIHRDLKPENVFITTSGRVKVLDFGLARADTTGARREEPITDVQFTEPGIIMGTIGYLAPEQAAAKPLTKATDVFALGCIFFEALTRRVPFEGMSSAHVLAALIRDPAPHLDLESDEPLAGAVDVLIQRCLAKNPEHRFAEAGALAAEIRLLLTDETEAMRLTTAARRAMRQRRRWPLFAAGAAIVIALAALLVVRSENQVIDSGYDMRVSDVRGDAETRRLVAMALHVDAQGNRANATELFEQAHRRSRETALPAAFLSSFADASGDDKTAIRWANEAMQRLTPDTPTYESLLVRDLAARQEREHRKQLALTQALLNVRPNAWRLHLAAAHMLLTQRDVEAALRHLKMIDIEKPDDRRLMLVLSDRASLGDLANAARDLQRSHLMAQRPAFSAYTLGRFAWTRGDVPGAITNFDVCAQRAAAENVTALEIDALLYEGVAHVKLAELAAAEKKFGLAYARALQMGNAQRLYDASAWSAYTSHQQGDAEERDRHLADAQTRASYAGDFAALRILAIRLRSNVWKSWPRPQTAGDPVLTGVGSLIDAREAWFNGNLDAARTALRRSRAEAVDATGFREEAELLSAELGGTYALLRADPPYPNLLRYAAIFDLARMRR